MGAPSKRAKLIRSAGEFDLTRLREKLFLPRDGRTTIDSWSLDDVFATREEQMLGQFVRPARLAEYLRTDDAMFVAWDNRLAPQRCLPVEMVAAPSAAGARVADEASALFGPDGVAIGEDTLADIHSDLVNHGVAFAACAYTPRADGSRVDVELHYWPIEYVRWDPVYRLFKARADPNTVQPGDIPHPGWNEFGYVGGYWIPVVHGDGRWIIFKKHDLEPFRKDAAMLPASLVWGRHAFSKRDWARASKAHGSAKVVGELPEGMSLQDPSGSGGLSPEAASFIALLQGLVAEDAPAGIRPAGAKTEYLTNNSTAWQVWSELCLSEEKAAARIYLGTDGTLGAQGGAPGVDIAALFGVSTTKVRGDLKAISRGLDTGLVQPWTAINFGDSRLAPRRKYVVPNENEEKVSQDLERRTAAFYEALGKAKVAGVTLSPAYIADLAADYRIRAPMFTQPSPTEP